MAILPHFYQVFTGLTWMPEHGPDLAKSVDCSNWPTEMPWPMRFPGKSDGSKHLHLLWIRDHNEPSLSPVDVFLVSHACLMLDGATICHWARHRRAERLGWRPVTGLASIQCKYLFLADQSIGSRACMSLMHSIWKAIKSVWSE